MYKLLLALILGAAIGSVITYQLKPAAPRSIFPAAPKHEIAQVPEFSVAEAQAHRQERYASIKTIEDTLALPTDFAETEALYVIAGRADSAELHNLIFQASRIGDRHDRVAALRILLSRFTELDPYSALAIARDPMLADIPNLENVVWETWGELNLDNALKAAQSGSSAQKNVAAQALYSSIRNYDAEKVQRIKSALGVSPGRNALAQQIYSLAAESPAEAIRFIEANGAANEQNEQFMWLAQYMVRLNIEAPADYAKLIQSPASRAAFEEAMATFAVQAKPEAALANLLAEPENRRYQSQAYNALHTLAQQDPDKAIAYLDRFQDKQLRQGLMSVVMSALTATDPQKALAWVRDNDKSVDQSMLASIIGQIAQHDPQLALTEAQSIQNTQTRQQTLSMIVQFAAMKDPAEAAGMLALIGNSRNRGSIISQLGQQWSSSDFEAAVQWARSLSARDQQSALQGMGENLVRSNVDRAIQLLDRFPDSSAQNLKIQIVQNLAQSRSIEAAQAFIAQYKGTEDYPRLQMTVISQIAGSDPDKAMQMAASLPDERLRDQAYTTAISRKAANDPRRALQWLESMTDPRQRQQAMARVVYAWNSSNPDEANTWVNSLPQGADRDDAVVAMLAVQRDPGPESRSLIATISDEAKRKQAQLGVIGQLMQSDPDEAERLLMSLDLDDSERNRYEQMLEHVRYNQYGVIH